MADSSRQISAEMNVLVCCARRNLDSAQRVRLKSFLPEVIDWAMLIRLAHENGLLPLLYEHLQEIGADCVPREVLSKLREENRQSALRALFLSAELLRIAGSFSQENIPFIPYKGPALAVRAYGNPSLRQFDDLDIVVPQRCMAAVYDEMATLGYASKVVRERCTTKNAREIPGEYVFLHKVNHCMVEVHTEMTLRHFPVRPDVEAMIRRGIRISMNGKEVPSFAREDGLLMLVVHGAKDFWARLIWVADVAEIIRGSRDIAWDTVFAEARGLKLTRMLKLGLWLAHEILGAALPGEVAALVETDRAAARLGSAVSGHLLAGRKLPGSILRRSLYRIRMTESLRDGLRYWVRLSTAPAEEDWSMLDVPKPLARSYALLRPLRLWKKYRSGAARS
ncbi:MAG: nucleotidyltransferase family protein [Candidatus Acidiferrales bacterium]